ncbi:hypothetical protein QK900_11825 [Arsenicicoccus dermatophilus]
MPAIDRSTLAYLDYVLGGRRTTPFAERWATEASRRSRGGFTATVAYALTHYADEDNEVCISVAQLERTLGAAPLVTAKAINQLRNLGFLDGSYRRHGVVTCRRLTLPTESD